MILRDIYNLLQNMHLCILFGHTTFHRLTDCSFCPTPVKISSTDFEANGSLLDFVHSHFWSLGKSLHLPANDMASFFDGK